MITVVKVKAKQATGSRCMFTDKFAANYFFIRLSLTCFEEAKDDVFMNFEVIFLCQKSAESFQYFFLLENLELGEKLL